MTDCQILPLNGAERVFSKQQKFAGLCFALCIVVGLIALFFVACDLAVPGAHSELPTSAFAILSIVLMVVALSARHNQPMLYEVPPNQEWNGRTFWLWSADDPMKFTPAAPGVYPGSNLCSFKSGDVFRFGNTTVKIAYPEPLRADQVLVLATWYADFDLDTYAGKPVNRNWCNLSKDLDLTLTFLDK